MGQAYVFVLVLFYLFAAFDTIARQSLLERLNHPFGIKNKALGWMRSYLSERY